LDFNIKIKMSDTLLNDAIIAKKMLLEYASQHLDSFLSKIDCIPRLAPLVISVTDGVDPFVQINIDLYGIMRVIGGVSYSTCMGVVQLILVDEGASLLLFQLKKCDGLDKALFHGGLNGTEFKRFQATSPGHFFNYYKRVYRKLPMREVVLIVDPSIIFYYDTPKTIDDPRKKKSNGTGVS
jgi:hypothetical protein